MTLKKTLPGLSRYRKDFRIRSVAGNEIDMIKDKDIREPLFDFLEESYGKIRIIEEKQIGKSRADIMMVTEDSLYGIEIKSDADTYVRLDRQIKDYNRFFDYNIIAVGSRHAGSVAEHVPDWWGIITIDECFCAENDVKTLDFYILREACKNPKREKKVKLRNQLSFLWRLELAHIQEINNIAKYRQKSKLFVINKIMEKVDVELLKRQISDELFERDYNTIAEKIAEYKSKK